MSKEVIMLAKTYKKPKDLHFPIIVTEKLDGVAADVYKDKTGRVWARSRQDETYHSVPHIIGFLKPLLPKGAHVVGELYCPDMDFKDISGDARRQEVTAHNLSLYVYDYYVEGKEDTDYATRMGQLQDLIAKCVDKNTPVRFITGKVLQDQDQFDDFVAAFKKLKPNAEGMMIRAMEGPKSYYKQGWRSPGMLKNKLTETIDLRIHSFEEAIDKNGKPKGMVGRINVLFAGTVESDCKNDFGITQVIGVGPGKMSHAERTRVWAEREQYTGRTIEVAYMPDDSYDALREPRFYRFRPDKD